jgi:hypothetical protein
MLVCALPVHIAHETAGAARIRHSLRPLSFEGQTTCIASGASRREIAELRFPSLPATNAKHLRKGALATKLFNAVKWIASRSLSSGAHSRDPLARNDGIAV